MNLRVRRQGFRIWASAQADIDRICEIWRECLETWGGPWLLGRAPCVADAMYAPVVTRFQSYDVQLEDACASYCAHIRKWAPLLEWSEAAQREPELIDELEVEF